MNENQIERDSALHTQSGALGARELVAFYVDESRTRFDASPPKRMIGQVAKQIGELLREGFDPDDLREALRTLAGRRLNPSVLPSLAWEFHGTAAIAARQRYLIEGYLGKKGEPR